MRVIQKKKILRKYKPIVHPLKPIQSCEQLIGLPLFFGGWKEEGGVSGE
jgi:hypothetical protein